MFPGILYSWRGIGTYTESREKAVLPFRVRALLNDFSYLKFHFLSPLDMVKVNYSTDISDI